MANTKFYTKISKLFYKLRNLATWHLAQENNAKKDGEAVKRN